MKREAEPQHFERLAGGTDLKVNVPNFSRSRASVRGAGDDLGFPRSKGEPHGPETVVDGTDFPHNLLQLSLDEKHIIL